MKNKFRELIKQDYIKNGKPFQNFTLEQILHLLVQPENFTLHKPKFFNEITPVVIYGFLLLEAEEKGISTDFDKIFSDNINIDYLPVKWIELQKEHYNNPKIKSKMIKYRGKKQYDSVVKTINDVIKEKRKNPESITII